MLALVFNISNAVGFTYAYVFNTFSHFILLLSIIDNKFVSIPISLNISQTDPTKKKTENITINAVTAMQSNGGPINSRLPDGVWAGVVLEARSYPEL